MGPTANPATQRASPGAKPGGAQSPSAQPSAAGTKLPIAWPAPQGVRQGPVPVVATRSHAMLEFIAHVMDSSFATLGEGVVLGTMPAYLERFGARHARHLATYVHCDPSSGADAALAPLNVLSGLTGTEFEMVRSGAGHATKRLLSCEFASAFAEKSAFTKAMVCQLHRAAYQGAVNATLEPDQGYDVALNTRILFGGAHCDFDVVSRPPRGGEAAPATLVRRPTADEVLAESQVFYGAILAAFVEYLASLLPPQDLERLLEDCLQRTGLPLETILGPGTRPGSVTDRIRAACEVQ